MNTHCIKVQDKICFLKLTKQSWLWYNHTLITSEHIKIQSSTEEINTRDRHKNVKQRQEEGKLLVINSKPRLYCNTPVW